VVKEFKGSTSHRAREGSSQEAAKRRGSMHPRGTGDDAVLWHMLVAGSDAGDRVGSGCSYSPIARWRSGEIDGDGRMDEKGTR